MTEQQQFYIKFHGNLAKRTGLPLQIINYLRSQGLNKTKEELADDIFRRMSLPRQKRNSEGKRYGCRLRKPKKFYQELLAVLTKISDELWALLNLEATEENLQKIKEKNK